MCGLVAIANYAEAPPVDRAETIGIRDAMIARGPDGFDLWISPDAQVGLAHRRLSLVDLSEAGSQPMTSADGAIRIVFNGEIYNYRELRKGLKDKGFAFRSDSDTEVILQLYADQGMEMLNHLRGMYSFVIWDERNRRIFAARDPLGIKPLYYADNGATLRIASQVKALIRAKTIDTTREPAGEVGFLLWGYVPDPFTIYQAIRALPAGSYLVAERGTRPAVRYFCRLETELARAATDDEVPVSPRAVRERLRAAILDSVQRHMIADVPVGVFLSAGLDSTVIASLASELPHSCLRTITMGFDEYRGGANDETTLAAEVAQGCAAQHVTRWLKRVEFETDLEQLVFAMDQPSIDGVNAYFVAKAAHAAGLKAALSGIGGDELFGGYPSFTQVPRLARIHSSERMTRVGRAIRKCSTSLIGQLMSPKYAGLLEYGGSWSGAYLLRRALFMPWEIDHILDPDVAHSGWDRLQTAASLEKTVSAIGSPRLKITALESAWYMRSQLLRDSDWAGMAHSVEIRTPMADLEVVRAVAPIGAHGRLKPWKGNLAELPSRPLPRAISERRKTGFSVPTQEWIAQIDNDASERGLRGWARHLARQFDFELCRTMRSTSPTPLLYRIGSADQSTKI